MSKLKTFINRRKFLSHCAKTSQFLMISSFIANNGVLARDKNSFSNSNNKIIFKGQRIRFSNFTDQNLRKVTIDPSLIDKYNFWQLSDKQWHERLDKLTFQILRKKKTEPRFSTNYLINRKVGVYACRGCKFYLFHSVHKFDSGSGWLSFSNSILGSINIQIDKKLIIKRYEYHCARCKGHQGYVFPDGKDITKLRYSNNGKALIFLTS